MKKIFFITTILIFGALLSAQIIENAFTPRLLTPSFLNKNNLSMSNSASFTGGYSTNNQSYYQSVYTNHLNYRFNSKLDLKLDLNFVNFGTATYKSGIEFAGNDDNQSKVLPNLQLNWKPSETTSITIQFQQYYNPLDYYRW
ncbi:MAG TPA: hypothetical protein PLD62_00560 [Candidatus Cloacimonadota bacterium]|nr:hypothetical protein [Candidatus Cloacimonadota bacterium]